jgi:hypothetical protein
MAKGAISKRRKFSVTSKKKHCYRLKNGGCSKYRRHRNGKRTLLFKGAKVRSRSGKMYCRKFKGGRGRRSKRCMKKYRRRAASPEF